MSQDEFELYHPEFGTWFERLCINESTMRGVMWPGLIIQSTLPIGKTVCLCYAENFVKQNLGASVLYIDENGLFPHLFQLHGTAVYFEALQRLAHVEWLFYDNFLDSPDVEMSSFAFEVVEYIIRTRSDRYLPTFFATKRYFSEIQEILPSSLITPLSELKRISLYKNKLFTNEDALLISKEHSYKRELVV
jgi:hypothetical protein